MHITQKGEMRVLSDEHFKKFSRDLLSKKTLTWTLRGDLSAKLKLMGAWVSTPYSVEFSKDVEVPGRCLTSHFRLDMLFFTFSATHTHSKHLTHFLYCILSPYIEGELGNVCRQTRNYFENFENIPLRLISTTMP